jgi:hypothetical protein
MRRGRWRPPWRAARGADPLKLNGIDGIVANARKMRTLTMLQIPAMRASDH